MYFSLVVILVNSHIFHDQGMINWFILLLSSVCQLL